jgi:hypothetical protein
VQSLPGVSAFTLHNRYAPLQLLHDLP